MSSPDKIPPEGISERFNQSVLKIAKTYEEHFTRDPGSFKRLVHTGVSVAHIGASVYAVMVGLKMCERIESLEQKLKQELWDEAKAWCPGASKAKLIDVCKLIWSIENL